MHMPHTRQALHAHVTQESQDCDGRYSGGYIIGQTASERATHFGDLEFQERVAVLISDMSGYGNLAVGRSGLTWTSSTEEASFTTTARWCESENCAYPWSGQ